MDHFSHPYKDLVLRSNPKLMPLLAQDEKPVEFGRIACITCHDPHLWSPDAKKSGPHTGETTDKRQNEEGNNRNSYLRLKSIAGTFCIDCHGQEGLVKYKYFHDKARSRNRKLEYLH